MSATFVRDRHDNRVTVSAAVAAGAVRQLADGRAAVMNGLNAAADGDPRAFTTEGQFTVPKTASTVGLDGGELWWDHSAGSATPVPQYADRDFYLGVQVGDSASADTTCVVNLNVRPQPVIDLHRDGGDTAVVLTAGTPTLVQRGGSLTASFSATAEAQKLDWLSKRSIPLGAKAILDADVEVVTNADADVADLTIGLANGTHASDAESITEFAVIHLDMGADLNIDAASDDGTTDVNPTDTTVDWAVGTPFRLTIDARDYEDIKFYVNGVRVLSATTFTLTAATGPLFALFHLEKTADDSPGVVSIDNLKVRIAEQSIND